MTTLPMQPCECHLRNSFLLIIFWLLGVVALGASGLLAQDDGLSQLLLPTMIALPFAVFGIAWQTSEPFREQVLAIDIGVLVILHSWRMIGAGFLLLYAYDVLPGLFAWLAGLGDMLAAVGAVLIGTTLLKGGKVSRVTLLGWNSFGLLDFAIAVVIGTLLRSTWLGGTVNTDAMAQLPLSLIPTIIVPLYGITHLIIYLQLRNK